MTTTTVATANNGWIGARCCVTTLPLPPLVTCSNSSGSRIGRSTVGTTYSKWKVEKVCFVTNKHPGPGVRACIDGIFTQFGKQNNKNQQMCWNIMCENVQFGKYLRPHNILVTGIVSCMRLSLFVYFDIIEVLGCSPPLHKIVNICFGCCCLHLEAIDLTFESLPKPDWARLAEIVKC